MRISEKYIHTSYKERGSVFSYTELSGLSFENRANLNVV